MAERRMVHKAGGLHLIVETEDALEAALADGWQLHKVVDPPVVDEAPDPWQAMVVDPADGIAPTEAVAIAKRKYRRKAKA